MKQERLLEALSYVNQEYVEEAAPKAKSRRLRPWLAAAACLALAVGLYAAGRTIWLHANSGALWDDPFASLDAEASSKGKSRWRKPNADAQTILDYRIGGLYLGMPRQEVLELLGEPASKAKLNVYSDGSVHESWSYKLSDVQTSQEEFTLDFAKAGEGWVLNEIICYQNCTLELPHGIRMGMTNEELLEAWPELEKKFLVDSRIGLYEADGTEHPVTSYSQYHKNLQFGIILNDGVVDYIHLGTYYEDPPWDEEPSYPGPDADAQTILDYRIGGMYLGMPQKEVLERFGQPQGRNNGGPVVYEDGSVYETWDYKLTDDPDLLFDFSVSFADKGDGWVVNEIVVSNDINISLPHDIQMGMSDAELRAVWPEITEEATYDADAGGGEANGIAYRMTSYSQSNGVQWFNVDLKNGAVCYVYLGPYYAWPPEDWDAPAPEEPYSFSSGEITVWRRTDSGWEAVQRTEHGAKMLETIFSIEDLVPLERDPDGVRYVVDFQNGTVCLVCAPVQSITAGPNTPPDAWGGVYRLEDRDAFAASLVAGDAFPQGLTSLEQCIFPYGTWEALGEAFK